MLVYHGVRWQMKYRILLNALSPSVKGSNIQVRFWEIINITNIQTNGPMYTHGRTYARTHARAHACMTNVEHI